MSSISKAERSYIQTGLTASPTRRQDGRSLHEYRAIALETGVAPLANGSARLHVGRNDDGSGGTEILSAVKLQVETDAGGGRIVCSVTCSPTAYPNLSTGALDDLQHDLTTLVHQTLSHPSLHPSNLAILTGKKSWLLNLDIVVLSDAGNIHDAVFMAARAALWDTKIPRTRSVEFKARKTGFNPKGSADMDVDEEVPSGFDTRQVSAAADFELQDYWDEGQVLDGRDTWPVCITLNLESPVHFLDASIQEEASSPLRVLVMYSFGSNPPALQAMRTLGSGYLTMEQIQSCLLSGESYASELYKSLNAKLHDEDLRRNQKARQRFSGRLEF